NYSLANLCWYTQAEQVSDKENSKNGLANATIVVQYNKKHEQTNRFTSITLAMNYLKRGRWQAYLLHEACIKGTLFDSHYWEYEVEPWELEGEIWKPSKE